MAAQRGLVINQRNLLALGGQLDGGFKPRRAAADDRHFRMPVGMFVIPTNIVE